MDGLGSPAVRIGAGDGGPERYEAKRFDLFWGAQVLYFFAIVSGAVVSPPAVCEHGVWVLLHHSFP